MLLERCTWQEVENYLEGSKGILLPVGLDRAARP